MSHETIVIVFYACSFVYRSSSVIVKYHTFVCNVSLD